MMLRRLLILRRLLLLLCAALAAVSLDSATSTLCIAVFHGPGVARETDICHGSALVPTQEMTKRRANADSAFRV